MVRCALSSCLVIALAACGGGGKLSVGQPKPVACSSGIPEAAPWDGTPPAQGSVVIIQPSTPGKDNPTHVEGALVAYEVDVKRRVIRRQIVDDSQAISKMVVAVITNPMDNAGALLIYRPPPPPPDDPPSPIWDRLINDAIDFSNSEVRPCQAQDMPQGPINKF